ncbi:hypothetical protein [Arthrobacter sp. MA-N2]|uniref:hypothetical protein n=1 Tax=Arthrobacter sp. MA-N2 TaxID=1101188 RepID=UPI0004810856|nr:hypothetical protein [Arthrobacter sp. MA-N2]
MPTTHITESHLCLLLLTAGIKPRSTKEAAVRHQLTTALPARRVADTIGIAVDTATMWSQLSGGVWKDCPNLR